MVIMGDNDYYTSTCATCWVPFTSTKSQAEADAMRAEHECSGSPFKPKDS
jgi:hypothetical protein